ncbi:glycine rich domain-containing protein [uncultured Microbacterium sp.]|uniref:glycine rich domain-containing protein n=1 Tax=uncultured Microbacterium sp. TaxID=191216 RepID=UPI0025FE1030|nr:glycine rich domain-containing protein [uncultured Microbacterium sp.]
MLRRLIAAGAAAILLTTGLTATGTGASPASAAQTTCTPDAGYSQCVAFTYSGADQQFTLPVGAIASDVSVKMWGAGGGGTNYYTMNGGAGGFTRGVIDMSSVASTPVTVVVGQGGRTACYSNNQATGSQTPTYGGGGASGANPDTTKGYFCGASGGGRSAIRIALPGNTSASNEVMTAGGGGGTNDGTARYSAQAGAGGGTSGATGSCGGLLPGSTNEPVTTNGVAACNNAAGQGATATAGGAAGQANNYDDNGAQSITGFSLRFGAYNIPTAGTQFQGGRSGCALNTPPNNQPAGTFNECGGGGGGGYFGGGGGWYNQRIFDGPGGGGSGHVDAVVSSPSLLAGTAFTPPATTEAQYAAGIGVGGGTGNQNVFDGSNQNEDGGNGRVVFQFNLRPSVKISKASFGGVGTFGFDVTGATTPTDSITTTNPGVGNAVTSPTVHYGTVNTPVTIVESSGGAQYDTSIQCTDANAAVTGNSSVSFTNTKTASIPAAGMKANAAWTCVYSNTYNPAPRVQIAKVSVGGVGTFGFTVTGASIPADSITTVASGTAVTSTTVHQGTAGTAVTIGESSGGTSYNTSIQCVDANSASTGNAPLTFTNTKTAIIPGSAMKNTASWTCTFTNAASVSVQVNKTWIIKDAGGSVVGTYTLPAQGSDTAPAVPSGFAAVPTLTGQTSAAFATSYTGYSAGQTVQVGETGVTVPAGCTVTSQRMTSVNGSPLGAPAALPYSGTLTGTPATNTFTITNTVTCTQTLTLVKQVAFGSLSPTSWTLTASGPVGSLPGPSGATGSTGTTAVNVTPLVAYSLNETSSVDAARNYVPTSAGWVCAAGSSPVPVSNSSVSVGYGQNVTCTIINTTARITVLKHIQDPASGLAANMFRLTLTPPSALGGPITVAGAESPSTANTFEAKPGATYSLGEQSVSPTTAYLALGLQSSTDGGSTWTAVSGTQVTPVAGTTVLYRFVNQSVPAIALPLTGGLGTDTFTIAAAGILAALILAVWLRRRFRTARSTGLSAPSRSRP